MLILLWKGFGLSIQREADHLSPYPWNGFMFNFDESSGVVKHFIKLYNMKRLNLVNPTPFKDC